MPAFQKRMKFLLYPYINVLGSLHIFFAHIAFLIDSFAHFCYDNGGNYSTQKYEKSFQNEKMGSKISLFL